MNLTYRWNSVFYLLKSILDLQPAVINTVADESLDVPVDFTSSDWKLMKKVVRVLEPFEEATKMLSEHDASISQVIPFVTTILGSLNDETPDDYGVLGMKRGLKEAMLKDNRFGNVENQEIYTVATLLDSRYKGYFFRNEETYADTKRAIIEKLVDALSEGGSNQATEARSAVAAPSNAPRFKMLMSAIIAKNQRDSQVSEVDAIRVAAQTALEHYLALPLSDPYDKTNPQDCFDFWRNYSVTTDKGQKALCHLARVFLTPPPTSTGMIF